MLKVNSLDLQAKKVSKLNPHRGAPDFNASCIRSSLSAAVPCPLSAWSSCASSPIPWPPAGRASSSDFPSGADTLPIWATASANRSSFSSTLFGSSSGSVSSTGESSGSVAGFLSVDASGSSLSPNDAGSAGATSSHSSSFRNIFGKATSKCSQSHRIGLIRNSGYALRISASASTSSGFTIANVSILPIMSIGNTRCRAHNSSGKQPLTLSLSS